MRKLLSNPIVLGAIGFVALFFLILIGSTFTTIPTGFVGIQVLFGKVQPGYLESGFNWVNPAADIVKIDLRTRKLDEVGVIPSQEMLSMKLHTSVNFRVDKTKAGDIYNTVGTEFIDKLVDPHVRSSIREVTSSYKANEFFSSKRNNIAAEIKNSLSRSLEPRGFIIEDVMLKEIHPPASIQKAIELKQAQQQEAEAMKFRLQRERLEAERKEIEAKGIQKFQDIVRRGIDENLLVWKGIEATEILAKSPNTKVVIIGNKDTKGLPLMLGDK